MLKHSSFQLYLSVAVLFCASFASPLASAACGCPADIHGAPTLGGNGLGESFPPTADVAPDPAWQVYEFSRDGIRYVQINDSVGRVRAAIGRIEGTFWVLPIGSDVDRVSISGGIPSTANSRLIYRSNEVEVVLYRSANQDRWIVRQPGPAQ
jgi:hypothetical protein